MIKLNDDKKKRHGRSLLEFINYAQKIFKNDKYGLLPITCLTVFDKFLNYFMYNSDPSPLIE